MRKTLISFVFALCCVSLTVNPAAAGINVAVDGDSYLVTGGVFHSDIYPGNREEAAHCLHCYWKITVICQTWDLAHKSCPYLLLKCPSTMRLAEVRRAEATSRPPTDSPLWEWQGYTCLGDGPPASERDINVSLHDAWRVLVPDLVAQTAPARATLINFPTRIRITSPLSIPARWNSVANTNVMVRARATQSISCDSACLISSSGAVFHTRGPHVLRTTLTWRGFYQIDGFSETEINALPIQQRAAFSIPVYALHRKLIPTKKATP
jgi:hypothetical protein